MEPSWKHADVFPIIARIIEQAYREHQRFITAQEIAVRLLQASEGRTVVEAAREQQHDQRPRRCQPTGGGMTASQVSTALRPRRLRS